MLLELKEKFDFFLFVSESMLDMFTCVMQIGVRQKGGFRDHENLFTLNSVFVSNKANVLFQMELSPTDLQSMSGTVLCTKATSYLNSPIMMNKGGGQILNKLNVQTLRRHQYYSGFHQLFLQIMTLL